MQNKNKVVSPNIHFLLNEIRFITLENNDIALKSQL